jgi:hypothetical protein
VHALVELHEIALNPLVPTPAGFGFGPIDQAEPCEWTSSGDLRWVLPVNARPITWVNDPAAKHCLREGHDTPVSSESLVPASLGTRCTTHRAALAGGAPVSQQPITNNKANA